MNIFFIFLFVNLIIVLKVLFYFIFYCLKLCNKMLSVYFLLNYCYCNFSLRLIECVLNVVLFVKICWVF